MNNRFMAHVFNCNFYKNAIARRKYLRFFFGFALAIAFSPGTASGQYFSGPSSYTFPDGLPIQCQRYVDSTVVEFSYVGPGDWIEFETSDWSHVFISFDNVNWFFADYVYPPPGHYTQKIYYSFSSGATTSMGLHDVYWYWTSSMSSEVDFDIFYNGVHPFNASNDGPACVGSTIHLNTNMAAGAASYEWAGPGSFVSTAAAPSLPSAGTGASGIYSVTTTNSGCIVSATTNVLVAASAGPITGNVNACIGLTTALHAPVPGGTWTSSSPAIAAVGTSGVVTGIAAGTAMISYASCSGYASVVVTVRPLPSAITGASGVCMGASATLSSATSGGTWSNTGSAAIATVGSATGVVTGNGTGVAVISYTVAGCSMAKTVTVQSALAAGSFSIADNSRIISTIAGTGAAGFSGDGGQATAATFTAITSTFVDHSGNIYVSDFTRIRKINPSGVITTIAGGGSSSTLGDGGPATAAYLNQPGQMAMDGTGNLYVAEFYGNRVRKITPGGIISTVAGTGSAVYNGDNIPATAASIYYANGLAIDPFGNMYISEWAGRRVRKIDAAGMITTIAGNGSSGSMDGVPATSVVLTHPGFLELDAAGNIYVSDKFGERVSRIDAAGIIHDFIGDGTFGSVADGVPATAAGLSAPSGIRADAAGNIYLAESTQHKVFKVDAAGIITTYAGGGSGGDGGPATAAQLSYPSDVAVAGDGDIIVSEQGSNKLRKITTGTHITGGSTNIYAGCGFTLRNSVPGGTWSSGSASIATVGTAGTVTGIAAGSAVISYAVTNACNSTLATVTINVLAPPAISGASSICTGATATLTTTVTGGTWSSSNTSIATIGSTGVVTALSAGTTIISYVTGCGAVSKILTVSATSCPAWKNVGSTGFTTGAAEGSNIATAPDGTPYVVFADVANGSKVSVMKYNGTNWVYVGIPGFSTSYAEGTPLQCTYIAINTAGTVYVAYIDHTDGPVVKKFISGSWVSVGTPAGAGALALASDGTPYVADWGVVQRFNGSSWINVGASGFMVGIHLPGARLSLAIDTANRPVVAYPEFKGFTDNPGLENWVRVARYNGSSWIETITPPDAPSCDGPLSVAGNSLGTLYFAASLHGYMVIGTDAGSGWSTAFYFSPAGTNYPQLAVGSDGVPLVAHSETYSISGLGASVRGAESPYAVVGVRGISAGQADNVSIAVNSAGVPFVSFRDYANEQKLTVMKYAAGMSGISGSYILCAGTTTTLTDAVNHGSWSSGNTSVATVGPTSGIVTGVAPGTAIITYSASSCFVTATVTVNAGVGAISGPSTVCTASTITLTNSVSGGVWSSANTSTASAGSTTGVVTGVAAGSTTISYTVATGCGTLTATKNITVNGLPVAGTISGTGSVCVGSAITLTTTGTGGVWSSSNTAAGTVSAAGAVVGIAAGTTTISYTVTGACGSNTATMVVTVNGLPSPGVISGPGTVCIGSTITLADGVSGGVWSSSNTSVATIGSASGVVSGVAAGNATISYTVTNGCGAATATQTVTVNAASGTAPITGTPVVCAGATTELSDADGGGNWSSADASIATVGTNGTVSGISAGTTVISYIVINACGSTAVTALVTVNPLPNAGTITGTAAVCAGATTTLSNAVTGGVWTSGNSSVATVGSLTGVVTGVAAGSTTISYAVTNGCGTTATAITATVNTMPGTSTITGATAICPGATVALSSTVSGGVWTSGNTAVATVGSSSGIVTGVDAGSTSISYALTNGCGTGYSMATVTVNALADAGTITGAALVCEGATTTLGNIISGGVWSSSGTGIATVNASSGVVTGVAAGTAIVSYAITNDCSTGYSTKTVTVNPLPDAGTITGTAAVCPGATTTLSNAVAGGVWTSGNTSIAAVGSITGVVSGVTAGNALISYAVTNSCGTTSTTVSATVNPLPDAGTITGTGSMCPGATIALSDAVSGGVWSSSASGVAAVGSATGVVTGVATGNAAISYAITNSCGTAVASTIVTVNAVADAGTITGASSVMLGANIALSATVSGGTWSVSNANATVSAAGVVTGVTLGSTIVSYAVTNGCGTAVTTKVINIVPFSLGGITGTLSLCQSTTTTLGNATTGGSWNSSNFAVATVGASSGIVTGVAAGTAKITYSYSGYSTFAIVTVMALPAAISGAASVCINASITLTDATSGGTWSSSNAALGTVSATGVVTGIAAGTPTISYTLGTGCFRSMNVTVKTLPGGITGNTGLCIGGTSVVTAGTGTSWSSSNPAVAKIGAASGVITGVSAGTSTITFNASTGCIATKVATVNTAPSVTTITGPSGVLIGGTITLSNATSGGVWSSNSPARATVNSAGVVTGISAPAATISYTVASGVCTISVTKLITVTSNRPDISAGGEAVTGIKVYPNPTNGVFTVESFVDGVFAIYTLEGRQVQSMNVSTGVNTFDLRKGLAAGVYMCRFNGEDGGTVMVRLVLE